MLVTLGDLSPAGIYHLMTQVVVPRPIAWVVTDNGPGRTDDRWNLAPFSYFNAVASEPPIVMYSIGVTARSAGAPKDMKDTLANLTDPVASGEHTIALPTRGQLEAVEATSSQLPHGQSEFALAGLEAVAWEWPVPRPSGVRAALGCTVEEVVPIANGPQRVILARVHVIWVDDTVVEEDQQGRTRVDPARLDPLMRLGAGNYAEIGPITRADRGPRPDL